MIRATLALLIVVGASDAQAFTCIIKDDYKSKEFIARKFNEAKYVAVVKVTHVIKSPYDPGDHGFNEFQWLVFEPMEQLKGNMRNG